MLASQQSRNKKVMSAVEQKHESDEQRAKTHAAARQAARNASKNPVGNVLTGAAAGTAGQELESMQSFSISKPSPSFNTKL